MRRTKIICTIGPKTETEDMMGKLIAAGMNIARINISHGDPDWHAAIHARLKAVSKDAPFPLGIMVDTQGPEIRTSATEVDLQEGDTLKIAISSACDIQEGEKHTFVNYEQLIHSVKKGDTILVDDGLIALASTTSRARSSTGGRSASARASTCRASRRPCRPSRKGTRNASRAWPRWASTSSPSPS